MMLLQSEKWLLLFFEKARETQKRPLM